MTEYRQFKRMIRQGWKIADYRRSHLDTSHLDTLVFQRGGTKVSIYSYNRGTIPKIMAYAAKKGALLANFPSV